MQDIVHPESSSHSESFSPIQIKLEQASRDSQSWWSLPSLLSDQTISIRTIHSSSQPDRSASVPSRATRVKNPYPLPRDSKRLRHRRLPFSDMSGHYGTWPPATVRNEPAFVAEPSQAPRKSSDGDRQQSYHSTQDGSVRRPSNRSEVRPHSSGSSTVSSSLTGAMGDLPMSTHSSPSSDASYHDQSRSHSSPSAMDWGSEPTHPDDMIIPSNNPIFYYTSPTATISSINSAGTFNLSYAQYNQGSYLTSSDSTSSTSGFIPPPYSDSNFNYSSRSIPSVSHPTSRPPFLAPAPTTLSPRSPASASAGESSSIPRRMNGEEEIRFLRNKVRELESEKEATSRRLREMQIALQSGSGLPANHPSGLPSPLSTPPVAAFQESWKTRTNARIRAFCSLNRAGNALCAWHDSRRERRAYPPRMAPQGYLNCGCSFEEALFEESLARHGVGSYHPGESVRMDPALRNPLLKLLKNRYGYRDGEFERDPVTGLWFDGEGPSHWENRAQAGTSKKRVDDRRS